MEAKLSEELGIEPELIKGSGGVFDVTADDELVFSKHATGQFPDENEIVELLRSKHATTQAN